MNRAAQIIHLNYARREHLTGKGIGIAIFDTGIGYHPDLFSSKQTKLAAFIDTIYGKKKYYDDNGHGTHIAGILAGSGKTCNGMYSLESHGYYNIIKNMISESPISLSAAHLAKTMTNPPLLCRVSTNCGVPDLLYLLLPETMDLHLIPSELLETAGKS